MELFLTILIVSGSSWYSYYQSNKKLNELADRVSVLENKISEIKNTK